MVQDGTAVRKQMSSPTRIGGDGQGPTSPVHGMKSLVEQHARPASPGGQVTRANSANKDRLKIRARSPGRSKSTATLQSVELGEVTDDLEQDTQDGEPAALPRVGAERTENDEFTTPQRSEAMLSDSTKRMLKRLSLQEAPPALQAEEEKADPHPEDNFAHHVGASRLGRPQVDILGVLFVGEQPVFLVRLLENQDTVVTYHLRKLSDFARLDISLREAATARVWGDAPLAMVASLPEGVVGGSDTGVRVSTVSRVVTEALRLNALKEEELGEQRDGLQAYLQLLVAQVKSVKENRVLKAFFGPYPLDDENVLNMLVTGLRSDISLKTMAGFWKLQGSIRVWKIQESGTVEIDGKYRGAMFDMKELGRGRNHRIKRGDDWEVDLDKSSPQKLVWRKHGEARLVWRREDDELAHATLAKVAQVRQRNR